MTVLDSILTTPATALLLGTTYEKSFNECVEGTWICICLFKDLAACYHISPVFALKGHIWHKVEFRSPFWLP
jgi:hypothetical protein